MAGDDLLEEAQQLLAGQDYPISTPPKESEVQRASALALVAIGVRLGTIQRTLETIKREGLGGSEDKPGAVRGIADRDEFGDRDDIDRPR